MERSSWIRVSVHENGSQEFQGAYEFSLFGQRWVVLCNADAFMEALKLRPYKIKRASMLSEAIASLGVKGVFNAEGQQWNNDRRLVGPQLNKNHVEDYFPNIKLAARRLIAKWENENGTVSTVMSDLYKHSLYITALSILGMDFDTLDNPHNQLANDIGELFEVIFKKLPFCGNIDGGRELSGRVLSAFKRVVDDYRKEKLQRQQHDENDVQKNGSPKTFLQKLIDISDGDDKKLEEERVVCNLATLLFAGTDTTSTTIAICLWEVANDSILQDELYQEVMESGLYVDNLTLTDVSSGFPRLHSFLNEVLRTKGPGPFIFLEPAERVEIRGRALYPGTMICALTTTEGYEAFSEIPTGPNDEGPEVFCPWRWLKHTPEGSLSVIKPSNKYGSYMPFGHGARVCPGASLAMAEAITGLFSILIRFELAPIENHPPLRRVSRFTQTFDSEIQLTLKPRQ